MADDGALPIRSYRLCFSLERRIHAIDRWRIPVPYGVPLRGIAYALSALALVLLLQRLPLAGELLGLLHPALRLLVLPVGAAYLLAQLRVDGRPAHLAALAWLRHRLAPRRVAAFRAADPLGPVRLADVTLAPDERSGRYRPAVIRGPAALLLRYPATASRWGRTLALCQRPGEPLWRGKRLRLDPGQRVRLR